MNLLGVDLALANLFLGLVIGMTYGLLAVGLVIVYRVSKVINFAHGAIGTLGASALGLLVVKYNVPYWIAFTVAIAVSAGAGAIAEAAVVRRLRNAPRIMSLVATLGLAAFFSSLAQVLFAGVSATLAFPNPSGLPTFRIGALLVLPAFSAMLIFSPLLVLAFAAFLRYSRYGLALRASAANASAARVLGIYSSRMSLLAWAVASAFAGFTAILVLPTRGFSGGEPFGPSLLLRALAAAVVARMTSLPIALAAGVSIGVIEQEIFHNTTTPGLPALFIFAFLFVAIAIQRRGDSRSREQDAWAVVAAARPRALPAAVAARVRRWTWTVAAVVAAAAGAIGVVGTNATAVGLAAVIGLGIVALSIGIVTGQGGHLPLGQFAFAGIGAATSLHVATSVGNFLLAFLAAGAMTSVAAVVVGIPALRIRGIMYAVATLGFGFAASSYLFVQTWVFSDGQFPRPTLFGFTFESGKSYYLWSATLLAFVCWIVVRVRRGALGRSFIALRDNEDAARSFAVPATRRTLQLFAIGGFIAGIGGATWAHAVTIVQPSAFSDIISINLVAAAVLGGLAYPLGPLLGALYLFAVPQFVHLDATAVATTALGWLLLVLYVPGGLGSLVERIRDEVTARLAPAGAEEGLASSESESIGSHRLRLATPARVRRTSEETILSVRGVSKRFGGVQAVDGIDLDVRGGEILGLIGPNGAGKTTLFEAISGFTRPDAGSVLLEGADITTLSPEARARRGLVRSFQDSRLFPTMTVLDALRLAQERAVPLSFINGVFGDAPAERMREEGAREVVRLMGLGPYADRRINELSTGTRRIAELACVVTLRPRVLLLDEPSTGIAQRESEALGEVLRRVREFLDATLLVIEHDVPLVLSLADRVAAMEAGRLLVVGAPGEVARDPRVIESYLGGDPTAVKRSLRPRAKAASRR